MHDRDLEKISDSRLNVLLTYLQNLFADSIFPLMILGIILYGLIAAITLSVFLILLILAGSTTRLLDTLSRFSNLRGLRIVSLWLKGKSTRLAYAVLYPILNVVVLEALAISLRASMQDIEDIIDLSGKSSS